MILENWSALEVIAGFIVLLVFGSGPAFAWTDRWLDRTTWFKKSCSSKTSKCEEE